jgi:Zn-dependent protease with chaperone function
MNEADQSFTGGAFEGADDSLAVMGTITVSQFSVKFETEAFTIDLPTQGLDVQLDESGERVFFAHVKYPGWTVYCLDRAIMHHRCLQRFGLKERLEDLKYAESPSARHAKKVFIALGVLVGCMVGLWLGTDLILGIIVNALPAEWEQKVGKTAFNEFIAETELTEEPSLTNRLFLVSERLKRGLPYDAPKFKFVVADDMLINACALPNGQVIVMRGLIEAADPDELAGVLAHEMAHVIEKHGMRAIAQDQGAMFIARYLFGGDSALAAFMAGAAILGGLQYSRANEHDADAKAWEILMKANIDPRALNRFFREMRRTEGRAGNTTDIFSTHPATSERIDRLNEMWRKSPKKSGFEPVNGGPEPKRTF